MRPLIAATIVALMTGTVSAGEIQSAIDPMDVDDRRATELGLYVTAAEAATALDADPGIVFVDVRTRAEFQFVGHPDVADQNIPWRLLDPGLHYDGKSGYGMVPNPDFAHAVAALMAREGKGKGDPVFLMCRSGGRSAAAANALAALGYTNVWNVIDGFEGARDKATGHRTVEGWRNSGLSWGYRIEPAQAYSGTGG